MSEVNDITVKAEGREKGQVIARKAGSKVGRTSKKMRSAATLRARVLLKNRIREVINESEDLTISSFADMQGVRRQYMYKILGEDENIASLDQLMGFAEDLEINAQIQVD